MSDRYVVEPTHGTFPDEAVASWRSFIEAQQVRRLRDGRYQMFERVEDRDRRERVASSGGEEHSWACTYVGVGHRAIELDVYANAVPREALQQFLAGFAARWPVRITCPYGRLLTLDQLAEQIGC
jgi:hypothetical protein